LPLAERFDFTFSKLAAPLSTPMPHHALAVINCCAFACSVFAQIGQYIITLLKQWIETKRI
jgi:hypothetical protein